MVQCFWKLLLTVVISHRQIVEAKCLQPPRPYNGHYVPLQPTYELGQKVTYVCSKETVLLGSQVRKCQRNGNWTDEMPFCDLPKNVLHSTAQSSRNSSALAADGKATTCSDTLANGKQIWTGFLKKSFVFAVKILSEEAVDFRLGKKSDADSCINIYGNFSGIVGKKSWKLIIWKQYANMIRIHNTQGNSVELCEIQFFAWDVGTNFCTSPPDIDFVENGRLVVGHSNATIECEEGFVPNPNFLIQCTNGIWVLNELKCLGDDPKEVQKPERKGSVELVIGVVKAVVIALGVICIMLVIILFVRKRQLLGNIVPDRPTPTTRAVENEIDEHYYEAFIYSDIPDNTDQETELNPSKSGRRELPQIPTVGLAPVYCVPAISQFGVPCCVYRSYDHFPPYVDTEPQDAYRVPSDKCLNAECSHERKNNSH